MTEQRIHELKQYITSEVTRFLLEGSKQLFNDNPDMSSFGWHQFTNEWARDRYIRFEESLERPDISGSLGEYIYASNPAYQLQQKVAEFLKLFDKALLQSAFGDGIDVTIYKDETIEILGDKDYDTNGFVAFEL